MTEEQKEPLYPTTEHQAIENAFAAYREAYEKLEAVKEERAVITGPLYKKVKATEKQFKPRIDEAKEKESEKRDALELETRRAYDADKFPEDTQRLTLSDGSWVQVDEQGPVLHVTDWWKLLQNEYVRENLIADVDIRFNKVAVAMAEEGKEIPHVVVSWPCKIKIYVEPKTEEEVPNE